jgi:hypothetical protein
MSISASSWADVLRLARELAERIPGAEVDASRASRLARAILELPEQPWERQRDHARRMPS